MINQNQIQKDSGNLTLFQTQLQREMEAWVVNTLKVKMIRKLDRLLLKEGKINSRKLFLVPIFSITDLFKRIETQAPEIKTMFFKELAQTMDEMISF